MMRNLLNRVLHLPTITFDQLKDMLYFNQHIIKQTEKTYRPLTGIEKSQIRANIDETSPFLGMFYQVNAEILASCKSVQNKNPLEEKKHYEADDITPIFVALLENAAGSFSLNQIKVIQKKLDDLYNLISPIENPTIFPDAIRAELQLFIVNLTSAINYKYPTLHQDNSLEETRNSISHSELEENQPMQTSSSTTSLRSVSSDDLVNSSSSDSLSSVDEPQDTRKALEELNNFENENVKTLLKEFQEAEIIEILEKNQIIKIRPSIQNTLKVALASKKIIEILKASKDEHVKALLKELDIKTIAKTLDKCHGINGILERLKSSNDASEVVAILKKDQGPKEVIALLIENDALCAVENQKLNLTRELEALRLKQKMNWEIYQYRLTLATYIRDKLESDPDCREFISKNEYEETILNKDGTPVLNSDNTEKKHKILNLNKMISAVNIALTSEENSLSVNSLKALTKKSLNLTRAIANYKFVTEIETKLNPRYEDASNRVPLSKRLETLANEYPNMQKSLATVGDAAVDKATSGITGFFKKIFSSIKRYFSTVDSVETRFTKTMNKCRSTFFKITKTLSPEEKEEYKILQSQTRNETRITRQII